MWISEYSNSNCCDDPITFLMWTWFQATSIPSTSSNALYLNKGNIRGKIRGKNNDHLNPSLICKSYEGKSLPYSGFESKKSQNKNKGTIKSEDWERNHTQS